MARMLRLIAASVFLLFAAACIAQTTVKGVVEDSATHQRLANASVTYLRKGKTLKFARTDKQGQFAITVDKVEMGDQVQASMMSYGKRRRGVPIKVAKDIVLSLPAEAFMLKEVKVQGSRITGGRDTITYDLTRFATERDNSLKDVLKKLPGVDIAKNGTISYNSKEITRFTLEGLDLTGGRYNLLTENVRAKDVKKAEIVEHDQPIKSLRDKVISNDVGINITLKDEARDKFMATLKPYVLFDDPTHVAGSANVRQIGKKRQLMYDVVYDRKGQGFGFFSNVLGFNYNRLEAASVPDWYTVPSLSSPIDDERLRFNTSQRYGINRIQKTKKDAELRIAAEYERGVLHQQTSNRTEYNFDDRQTITSEELNKTVINDRFAAEIEHKVNTDTNYGNEVLSIKASQGDGLSEVMKLSGDGGNLSEASLQQRVRVPKLDLAASIYRLFPLKSGAQITWKSILDYHHGVSDLYIWDERNRLRTNHWHTQHLLGWKKKTGKFTQNYEGSIMAEDIHVASTDNFHLKATVNPNLQYKDEELRISFYPRLTFERFARQQKSMFYLTPTFSINWQPDSRSEIYAYASYGHSVAGMRNYALDKYRRDYRTWYRAGDIIPVTRTLYGNLEYKYKRPIREIFAKISLTASRTWNNATTDMQIIDGNYYYTTTELHSHSNSFYGNAMISKGFSAINTKVSLGISGDISKGSQLSGDQWYDYRTQSLAITPGIIFSPKWCEFDYEGSFSFNSNESAGATKSKLFNWRQSLTLTSTIQKVDLSWKFLHYRNELQEGNVLYTLLSDVAATWRLKGVRLKAQLNNIFNKKAYETTTYSGIAVVTNSYVLRPRELILSAEFNL